MNREAPRRLRRAEAVLARRTGRFLLVLERCTDRHNADAVLRTAEGFGIQKVWMVEQDPPSPKAWSPGTVSKGADRWLDIEVFPHVDACIAALREQDWEIWATDLAEDADELDGTRLPEVPTQVALVLGRESDGVSKKLLAAADRRLRLPMQGFAESLNLSVAAGLFLAALFQACPQARGDLTDSEKDSIRRRWYGVLATSDAQREEFMAWADHPPDPLDTPRPAPEFRRPRVPKSAARRYGIDRD